MAWPLGRKRKQEEPEEQEVKIYQKPKSQPVEVEEQETPVKQVAMGRITAKRLLDKGIVEYLIYANSLNLGDVGDEFPID